MSGLEEYGIKDVGFVHGEASEKVPLVAIVRPHGRMDIEVSGSYKGHLYDMRDTGCVEDGAKLFTSNDITIWFDEVK